MSIAHFLLGCLFGSGTGFALAVKEWPLVLLFGALAALNCTMQFIGL